MSDPGKENFRYVMRAWIPAILGVAFVLVLVLAALTSGDASRIVPATVALIVTTVVLLGSRRLVERKHARMLQSAEPDRMLASFANSLRKIPHGSLFAAAHTATILGYYGRFEDAERALVAVSWGDAPPLVQAQRSTALATIAYARGEVTAGLDHAVAATAEASIDGSVPGAKTSELAFRNVRNLGLALAARESEATERELRHAFEQLPLLGRIAAAWGMAAIAGRRGDVTLHQSMVGFVRRHAPHFRPVLSSIE